MKITKSQLKQLIKEELDNINIDKAIEDKAAPIAKILFDQGVGPDHRLHQHLMNYFKDILEYGQGYKSLPHRDAFFTPEAFTKADPNALQPITKMVKELERSVPHPAAPTRIIPWNLASHTRDAINKLFLARKKG